MLHSPWALFWLLQTEGRCLLHPGWSQCWNQTPTLPLLGVASHSQPVYCLSITVFCHQTKSDSSILKVHICNKTLEEQRIHASLGFTMPTGLPGSSRSIVCVWNSLIHRLSLAFRYYMRKTREPGEIYHASYRATYHPLEWHKAYMLKVKSETNPWQK